MIVVKEHASTVRNRTGKVRFARAMPTTNPRTGMLWQRDWGSFAAGAQREGTGSVRDPVLYRSMVQPQDDKCFVSM